MIYLFYLKSLEIASFLLAMLIFLAPGCTPLMRPSGDPSLELLVPQDIPISLCGNDNNSELLEEAVGNSIRYYKRLPADRRFKYGELSYSPSEMISSMQLFLKVMKVQNVNDRLRELRDKFHIFASRNSEGGAFFTGYYEPMIEAHTSPEEGLTSPLYSLPSDLLEADLGKFREEWKDEKIYGKVSGRNLVPYDSRNEIVYGDSLAGRANILAFVNEIELFFLQIQGSGLIRFPDRSIRRVNFAGQNGRPYKAIGSVLKDRIPAEEMSLQSIKRYLYTHPDEARDILSYNDSYTFFREVEEGPLGDINVPLTALRSVAMDRRVVPRGGLVCIETEIPYFAGGERAGTEPFRRFVLVQDTGGAIMGHGRVDIFFGNGEKAELIAGHMKQKGRVFLFVAKKESLGKSSAIQHKP